MALETPDSTRRLEDEIPGSRRLKPGAVLAERYVIDSVVGSGGMGAVYRGRDLHFPNITKLVAVKEMIISNYSASDRQTMQQNFEREANIVASLSHPAIPRIYDFFSISDCSYLVMEFIQGKDLGKTIEDTKTFIPETQVLAWAIELCDVLTYLHHHKPDPIIFRDIKPSNMIINQFNHVVLIDFGIARAFQAGLKGTMMGTEGYSPPEQYRGEASPVADLYALGATLHHLLTRRDPQHEPPFSFGERPIRAINPSVTIELEAIVNRLLEYLPEDRFQSVEDLRAALSRLYNRTRSSGTGVVKAPTSNIHTQEIKPVWYFACEDEVRGAPATDGSLIFVGSLDNNLYAVDSGSGDFIWKFPTRGAIVSRPLVHDYFVYCTSEDHSVYALTGATGKLVWAFATGGMVRSSPSLLNDYLFVGSDDHFLHALNMRSSRSIWRFDSGAAVRSTAVTYDNLVYFGCEAGDVYCLDLFGQVKWHFRARRAVTSSPVVHSGLVFFGSLDNNFYAVEAKMGWEVWRYRMQRGTISTPAVAENVIVTGAVDGNIVCLDSRNGREVWTYRTGHQVTGSPAIYQESVFCGSVDGNMYALDLRTGKLQWKFATGGPITGTPIILNEVLYFGSTDHRLYALNI